MATRKAKPDVSTVWILERYEYSSPPQRNAWVPVVLGSFGDRTEADVALALVNATMPDAQHRLQQYTRDATQPRTKKAGRK